VTLEVKVKQLATRIEQLTRSLEKAKSEQRRGAFAARVIALALLLIVGVFVVLNYLHLRREWTREKLRAGVERELNELNPTASFEFGELAQYLVPIYTREAKRQFKHLGPEFSRVCSEQIDGMAEELRRDAHEKLRTMDERIRDRSLTVVSEVYPDLMSPAEQEQLTQSFRTITEDALLRAVTDFDSRFSKDARELQEDILRFDLRETHESTPDLQKKFIRLWLKLLDAEIEKI
jgi:hypothetical protein